MPCFHINITEKIKLEESHFALQDRTLLLYTVLLAAWWCLPRSCPSKGHMLFPFASACHGSMVWELRRGQACVS